MKSTRANFLPEQRFVPLRPALQEHLAKLGQAVTPENFLSICDEVLLKLLKESFTRIQADEGSIWLLDPEKQHLIAAYNSGSRSEDIVGFKLPVTRGIISLVVSSEHPFVENNVYKNDKQDKSLDKKLGKLTYAMIAVPLYFLNEVRGVISCVQLQDCDIVDGKGVPKGPTPPGFGPAELDTIQTIAAVVRDLIDYRLMGTAVGWNRL
ncbi:MAG TPA: GAF domain-containing protein [Chthoniobacterales bacterium]|nr:GAF domain-containing protein [Chthoniobacterales bacterium]